MLWVLQDNLHNEYGYQNFIKSLNKYNADIMYVKPVPFSDLLLPAGFDTNSFKEDLTQNDCINLDNSQPIIIFGSNTLSRIAKANNWTPGTYLNDNYCYEAWVKGLGKKNLLNPDVIITKIKDVPVLEEGTLYFSRPTEDNKAFAGTVMSGRNFNNWFYDLACIDEESYLPLHCNTDIIISSHKKIEKECRFFVVNGKVVTGSVYKQGDMVKSDPNVPIEFIKYAQSMVDIWQPAEAFVLDIALCEEGYKVIEINNFNSSGFYQSDTDLLVKSLIDLY